MCMNKKSRASDSRKSRTASKRGGAGPVAFFISVFIVLLGLLQLFSTFHTYALNLTELNGLKKQEAALIAEKEELKNSIKRWNDKAYVTAQAREQLGFVFPGEQSIRVLHPEAVTGQTESDDTKDETTDTGSDTLPWYKELAYSLEQIDKDPSADSADGTGSSSNDASDADSGQNDSGATDNGTDNTAANTTEGQ